MSEQYKVSDKSLIHMWMGTASGCLAKAAIEHNLERFETNIRLDTEYGFLGFALYAVVGNEVYVAEHQETLFKLNSLNFEDFQNVMMMIASGMVNDLITHIASGESQGEVIPTTTH